MRTGALDHTRGAHLAAAHASLLRLKRQVAALAFELKLRRLLREKAYNPNQLRVPAGNPDGGRWTRDGGQWVWVAGGRRSTGSGGSRFGPNFPGATYGQLVRLDRAIARTEEAIAQVRQYDPNWRPTRQSVTSPGRIEGAIRYAEARAAEAEARFEQLRSGIGGNFGPSLEPPRPQSVAPQPSSRPFDGPAWIDAYRVANNAPDLFGRTTWPSDRGTVAVAEIDGKLQFGVNSEAPGYTDADWDAAARMRDKLTETYPNLMATGNVGRIPNNSLFHAESTLLLRAAEGHGGALKDKAIEVHIDQITCGSCKLVLPYLGVALGDPLVTFVERESGLRSVMWHGRWLRWRRK